MRVLNTSEKDLVEAAQYLIRNYPIVFPTDTVYGIGARISSFSAIEKIYQIKKRNKDKLLPIFISSMEFLFGIVEDSVIQSIYFENLVSKFWPGPLTIVLKKNKNFKHPFYINSEYIAIRSPDHFVPKILMEYIKEPLVCSSANISGVLPLSNVKSIVDMFSSNLLEVVLDGGEILKKEVSTIIKLFPNFEILREGKIKKEELLNVF